MKKKIRFHYRYWKIALFQTFVCFVLSIACFFELKLLPLFVFSMIDMILTVIPAFYVTIEDMEKQNEELINEGCFC